MSEAIEKASETEVKSSSATKAGNGRKRTQAKKARKVGNGKAKNERKTRTYPTIKETIEVDHAITQGAFDQLYDGFRSAFFHTTSILGRFGMEEGANQVHEYIGEVTDSAIREIEAATADIVRRIHKKNGPEAIPRTAPKPERKTVEVPAYVVRKYLTLFPAVDRMIDAIVCAETIGAISWTERGRLLKEAPKYLRSPAGRFHSLATKLGARQSKSEGGIEEAKTAMREALEAAMEQHRQLKGVHEKRPLKEKKAAAS